MKIKKRNGILVEFDKTKIETAIGLSLGETSETIEWGKYEEMLDNIYLNISDGDDVEKIQNTIEKFMMQYGLYESAKRYILYRAERNKVRPTEKYGLLSKEFLNQYKHKKPPMTQLGELVYYRTYSRYLEDKQRREYWWETVRRAVEYNCSLIQTSTDEAEKLYDNIFNLRQFLSGRSFWVGNTEVSKKYPMANYNCFRADEQFLTDKGIFKFSDFNDGDTVSVLNKNGTWSESTVNTFGKDEIVELHLRKSNSKYREVIHTTADHIWFKRITENEKRYHEVKTTELKQGDILRTKRRYEHQTVGMCNVGIQHGLVYGDGTFDKKKDHCKISLIGKKQSYLKYFSTGTICSEGDRDSTLVYGLPNDWKTIPENKNVEYINGFLYGLCLADASKDGSIELNQSSHESLSKIRGMFGKIGVLTSKVKEVNRNNNLGDYENGYSINIYRDTLPTNWTEFLNVTPVETKWCVEKVVRTGVIEDVYCVTEPETNTFTLANGILTHNCSFQVIDDFEAFRDIFYLLMIGSGAGIRILKSDVEKLPKIRTNVRVTNLMYSPVRKKDRVDSTSLIFEDDSVEIVVGDSKEGWVQSLDLFLRLLWSNEYRHISHIIINYNHVRPMGERLKTFGGHASGYEALLNIFVKFDKLFKKNSDNPTYKLKPIDCLDMANIIGEGVVVGGVRRTAEVMLMDTDDQESIDAKTNLYTQIDGQWIVDKEIIHRQMSNNSIFYESKPSRDRWHWQIQRMRYSGEPAYINAESARKRRPNFEGGNPLTS